MPRLLVCVAVYSLADAVNVTFAFALRGAGDTRFVSLLTFALAWPIMVVPTAIVVGTGASVYWAWGFATATSRHGRLLLLALPHRQVEEHARHRSRPGAAGLSPRGLANGYFSRYSTAVADVRPTESCGETT